MTDKLHRGVVEILTPIGPRYLQLTFGSDGGMQLWLNGAKVGNGKVFRRVAPAPDEALVLLKPGENSLLLKVHHGSGVYGFLFAPPKQPVTKQPVEFSRALADYSQKDFDVKLAIDDKADTGWAVEGQDAKLRGNRTAIFLARGPVLFAGGTRLTAKLKFEAGTPQQVLGRFRLACSSSTNLEEFAGLPQNVQSALFAGRNSTTAAQEAELKEYYRENFDPGLKKLMATLAETRQAANDLNAKIPTLSAGSSFRMKTASTWQCSIRLRPLPWA